ncbi:MAG: hypothetical protein ACLFQX_10200, partial [Candidatus Kapaibacterium sp.]
MNYDKWKREELIARIKDLERQSGIGSPETTIVSNEFNELDRLRASEEHYRLMAGNSTDMISRHTPEGIYMYA